MQVNQTGTDNFFYLNSTISEKMLNEENTGFLFKFSTVLIFLLNKMKSFVLSFSHINAPESKLNTAVKMLKVN